MTVMATFIETPPGSGLYQLVEAVPAADIEIMPRVGPNPMIVHYTAGNTPVTAAVQPDKTHVKLRPGRPIRVGISHQTLGNCWLWYGFIDEIEPRDSPEDWSTVRLRCIDALGEAGRAKLASTTEVGAGETAWSRVIGLLNAIRWPSTKRDISTSAIRPLYAAKLDGQVVDLLRQTADSEGGWCFADNDGNIVLQHRDWPYFVTADIDATIGNVGVDDVCPTSWERSFARGDIATRVIFDRDLPTGEPEQEAVVLDDEDGQTLYGIEPYERRDLWTLSDTDLFQNAGRVLATRSATNSMPRIRSVTIDAASGNDAAHRDARIDLLAALSIHTPSRYRGRLLVDGRTKFDAVFFAVGVSHDISAEEWTADISLDRATPYERLDPATYVWDTARWDRSLWN